MYKKISFVSLFLILSSLGNVVHAAAAHEARLERLHMHDGGYSFEEFLKSPAGKAKLKELEMTGLSYKGPGGDYVFLHTYPASFQENRMYAFSDLGRELFAQGMGDPFAGYHQEGDRWPKEKLAPLFLGANAAHIIEKYCGAKGSFPPLALKIWASIPLFRSLEEAAELPFRIEEGHVLGQAIRDWWGGYEKKKHTPAQATKIFTMEIQKILNPEERPIRIAGENLREKFVSAVLREIAQDGRLVDFGVFYQRLKIKEEHNPQNKELTGLLDKVQDVMSYWVDLTFKYAVLHIMLGLPIEKAARDAEIELLATLPSSLHPHFLMEDAKKFMKT